MKVKSNNTIVQFSAQSDIFGKISLIQQNRQIDLKEVFKYPLSPIPWSIAEVNGSRKKCSKSTIMKELEKGRTSIDKVDNSFVPIFDGMALVRAVFWIDI